MTLSILFYHIFSYFYSLYFGNFSIDQCECKLLFWLFSFFCGKNIWEKIILYMPNQSRQPPSIWIWNHWLLLPPFQKEFVGCPSDEMEWWFLPRRSRPLVVVWLTSWCAPFSEARGLNFDYFFWHIHVQFELTDFFCMVAKTYLIKIVYGIRL